MQLPQSGTLGKKFVILQFYIIMHNRETVCSIRKSFSLLFRKLPVRPGDVAHRHVPQGGMYLLHLAAIRETGAADCIFESGPGAVTEFLHIGIGKKFRGEEFPAIAAIPIPMRRKSTTPWYFFFIL